MTTTKWSTRLEGGCPACSAKHLANAITIFEQDPLDRIYVGDHTAIHISRAAILDIESHLGYPGHRFLSCGVLSWMENRMVLRGCLDKAEHIREFRLLLQKNEPVCWADLIVFFSGGEVAGRHAWGYAELMEALRELPAVDRINRDMIRECLSHENGDTIVSKITGCLKAVVSTYELEGGTDGQETTDNPAQ